MSKTRRRNRVVSPLKRRSIEKAIMDKWCKPKVIQDKRQQVLAKDHAQQMKEGYYD